MIKIPEAAVQKFSLTYPEIFQSGNLAEGKWNQKLGELYRNYTHSPFALPFASNGSGILAILLLLKRYRGCKRIFIQSNTMYGVKTMSVSSGLDLIGFVPCDLPHLMPTVNQVAEFVETVTNPSDCVFLLTHIGGIVNPDIEEIAAICRQKRITLVEDCAHSLGATLNGKHTGLFGTAGVYSLYATKSIAAGEGGIAVTRDEDLGSLLAKFQIYDRFDQKLDIGVNFRISELQALFSFCVSEHIEEIIANKASIADQYIKACRDMGLCFVDPYHRGQRGNHYKFILIAKKDAQEEFNKIKNRTSPVYDYQLGPDPMGVHKRHICLPVWYDLDKKVIQDTVSDIYACR